MKKLWSVLSQLTKAEITMILGLILAATNQALVLFGLSKIPEETAEGIMALAGTLFAIGAAVKMVMLRDEAEKNKEKTPE